MTKVANKDEYMQIGLTLVLPQRKTIKAQLLTYEIFIHNQLAMYSEEIGNIPVHKLLAIRISVKMCYVNDNIYQIASPFPSSYMTGQKT